MRRLTRLLPAAAALAALPLVLLRAVEHRPAPVEERPVDCAAEPGALARGQTVKLLSWNIQFAASRAPHFFYDGGADVRVDRDTVTRTLEGLSAAIRDARPDLLLLQEVDRDSARTARIDQLPALAGAMRTPCTSSATYHKSPYVPHPLHQRLGRVDMHLALVSRFPLRQARRVQLPLLDEPRWRQAFNLKRALLHAEVPVEGLDHPLAVAVTHLSAFSRGDGTLAAQVAVLERWMAERPPGQPWVLAGDFNLLPPGDDPSRLADAALYADAVNPIERLIPRFQEVFGAEGQLLPRARTYLPHGAEAPDRKIDYVFVGGPLQVIDARVLTAHAALSDHLPVSVTLRLGEAEAPGPAPGPRKGPSDHDTGKPGWMRPGHTDRVPGQLQPDSDEADTSEP